MRHPLSSPPTTLKNTKSSKREIGMAKSYFIYPSLHHDFIVIFVLCNSLNGREPPLSASQAAEFITNLRDSLTHSCNPIPYLNSLELRHTPRSYPISSISNLVLKCFKTAITHLRNKSTLEASSTWHFQSKRKEKESRWDMCWVENKQIKKSISKVYFRQYRVENFQSCKQDKRRRLLCLVENAS